MRRRGFDNPSDGANRPDRGDRRSSSGLSRGLDTLIGDAPSGAPLSVALDAISPNPDQPRRNFDNAELRELADSIREHGVLQPLLARRVGVDRYELIAGERRWRAAGLAGLAAVPVVLSQDDGADRLTLALVENLQREDLNPIEAARAYRQLTEAGLSHGKIAQRVGKQRVTVANQLRLLQLDEGVQALVESGALGEGHARALLAAPEASRAVLARRAVDEALSVRAVEREAKALAAAALESTDDVAEEAAELGAGEPDANAEDPRDLRQAAAERAAEGIESALGLRVDVRASRRGGRLTIRWQDLEQLERVARLIADGAHLESGEQPSQRRISV